ncbi:hypothetical protein ACVIJ6_003628 [Bradyrhizobium sp. USDA 4369]
MKPKMFFRNRARTIVGVATAFALFGAPAQAGDPAKLLKSMSDYLASQKTLSASFDSDIEIITPELQKIQFASSGEFKMRRPDKLRVRRTGGYADVELVYDGKTVSISGNNTGSYVQANLPGSVDTMIDTLQARSGAGLPGADLLLSDVFGVLMADVIESKHIGQGVVDSVECEHLAFRTPDTDWQIWIETGATPVPHKYVITSKVLAGAPQYTLRIKNWRTDAAAGDSFVFVAPSGATKVDLDSAAAVAEFDELPPGTPAGEKTGEKK